MDKTWVFKITYSPHPGPLVLGKNIKWGRERKFCRSNIPLPPLNNIKLNIRRGEGVCNYVHCTFYSVHLWSTNKTFFVSFDLPIIGRTSDQSWFPKTISSSVFFLLLEAPSPFLFPSLDRRKKIMTLQRKMTPPPSCLPPLVTISDNS